MPHFLNAKVRRLLGPLALLCAMLLTQHGAWVHALSHVVVSSGQQEDAAQHDPSGLVHEQACEQCLAFHAGTSTVPMALVVFAAVPVFSDWQAAASSTSRIPQPTAFYQSRAPPQHV